jgi:hypothetical protein
MATPPGLAVTWLLAVVNTSAFSANSNLFAVSFVQVAELMKVSVEAAAAAIKASRKASRVKPPVVV